MANRLGKSKQSGVDNFFSSNIEFKDNDGILGICMYQIINNITSSIFAFYEINFHASRK